MATKNWEYDLIPEKFGQGWYDTEISVNPIAALKIFLNQKMAGGFRL